MDASKWSCDVGLVYSPTGFSFRRQWWARTPTLQRFYDQRIPQRQIRILRIIPHIRPALPASCARLIHLAPIQHLRDNRAAFEEAASFPPLNYRKRGSTIDLSFWRAPERLFDEPDELVTWARIAMEAAGRISARRRRPGSRRA